MGHIPSQRIFILFWCIYISLKTAEAVHFPHFLYKCRECVKCAKMLKNSQYGEPEHIKKYTCVDWNLSAACVVLSVFWMYTKWACLVVLLVYKKSNKWVIPPIQKFNFNIMFHDVSFIIHSMLSFSVWKIAMLIWTRAYFKQINFLKSVTI